MAQAQAARRPGVDIFNESVPMWRTMLIFLIPLMLSNILQSASGTVNSILLGRLLGVHALAAISSLFPVFFFLISFLIGLSSGSTVLIGQAFGAGDEHRLKRVAGTAVGLSVWLGIAVALIGFLYTRPMLVAMGTPADILDDAQRYARYVFAGMPALFPYLLYTTSLRGVGDSRTPFYFLVVSAAVSVLTTPALIFGWFGLPRVGLISAAIAFIVSNVAALAALLTYLAARKHPLRIDVEVLRDAVAVDWKIVGAIVRIGIPTGIQMVMVSFAEIAVISFVNHFGSSATAAYGAVNSVVGYVQFPAISIGIASSIFGAQCIGARREDKLGKVVHAAVALNYTIGAVAVGLCYLFAWPILGWFITDPSVLAIAHQLLMITLWGYLVFGNSAVLSGLMRSSGDVIWPTAIGIVAIWGVEVPSAWLLMQHFGIDGVWMGYPIAFCCGLLGQFAYYTLAWKQKTHRRLV